MLLNAHFGSKSPFLPEFDIKLYEGRLRQDLVEHIKEIALKEETYILDNFKPYPAEASYDWITNRAYDYNFLNFVNKYPKLSEVKDYIHNQYKNYVSDLGVNEEEVYIMCWINIIRNDGRKIEKHHHAQDGSRGLQEYAYVSGHISIQVNETNTHYQHPILDKRFFSLKNEAGVTTLFPSWMIHWTDCNLSNEPRISLAFDIITKEMYNMGAMINKDVFIKL